VKPPSLGFVGIDINNMEGKAGEKEVEEGRALSNLLAVGIVCICHRPWYQRERYHEYGASR